ncbi:MAG: hypothetical protein ACK4QW_00215, partial [Alphaproteobacteria bacterium]
YRHLEFREDIKRVYRQAGLENKPTVFLFSDTQIKEEAFLEDISNILSSGVVPNLFPKDELVAVLDELRPAARAASAMRARTSARACATSAAVSSMLVVRPFIGRSLSGRAA